MKDVLFPVAKFNKKFNDYLEYNFDFEFVYRSSGLERHIAKRHPGCTKYIELLPDILAKPDYIGVNPNEPLPTFELVKIIDKNIQVGIKLDVSENYLYIATLHTITPSNIQHRLANGRLKRFDK